MAFWNSRKDKDKERSSAQQNTQKAQVKPETNEKAYKPDNQQNTQKAQAKTETTEKAYKPDNQQNAQKTQDKPETNEKAYKPDNQQNTQKAQAKTETTEKAYKPDKPKQTAQKNTEPYKPDYDQFAQTHDEHYLNAMRASFYGMPEELKKFDDAIRRAGKQVVYGLSEQESELLKGLRSTGITNTAAGNIDLPTASMDALVRAASGIPDAGKRKEAYGYLKGLTKVKNGRFYGYSLSGSDPGYIDSADMPKADYDVLVKELNAKFYASKGHEEENLREYLSLYDKIHGMPVTDVQKYWYTDALKSAYTEQTGLENPDVYELRKAFGEYDLENQETADAGEEEKKGWFSSLWEKIAGRKEEDGDALLRPHGGGLGQGGRAAAHALLHGVAQLMGQQPPAGGVAPVKSAPGEKDVLSGGEGVHAPLRRAPGGALVGVDAHGGQVPAIGTAHVAHHIGAVHEFRADVGGFLLRRPVHMQFLAHIHSPRSTAKTRWTGS